MTLWAINVRGPDDIIAVADAAEAHRLACKFNAWWTAYVEAHGLSDYDPHMWATPLEWWRWANVPHAEALEKDRHGEYAWLWADGMPAIPKPPRSPSPNDDDASD